VGDIIKAISEDRERYEALCKKFGVPVDFDRMYNKADDPQSLAALVKRNRREQ